MISIQKTQEKVKKWSELHMSNKCSTYIFNKLQSHQDVTGQFRFSYISPKTVRYYDTWFQLSYTKFEDKGIVQVPNLDMCRDSVDLIFTFFLLTIRRAASCNGCHAWGRQCFLNLEHLVVLLAGPISHTSTQYMDFVEIFNVWLDLSTVYFANFNGCNIVLFNFVMLSGD